MASPTRLERLHIIMQKTGLDILAFTPGPNLRYLTGGVHYVMERPIVLFIPLEGKPVAVIPKLEIPLFAKHSIESNVYSWADSEGYEHAFKAAFAELKSAGKTIGVEGLHMRFFEGEIIRKFASDSIVTNADEHLAELRIIKDSAEIDALRTAVRMSEEALQMTLDAVRVGMTEREIAGQLEANVKAVGGEGLSFNTILHGGANTPLPHMGPLDYKIQPGDPLLIDFGATYQGYCADITRVVFVGEPSDDHRAFYEVVKTANAAGRAAAKPGVTAESVDRAARQSLIDAGYESLIRHRTGHGIGLQAHEWPYIVEGNQRILEPGMVFTIEPGIYQMGVIGVRIEDDVLITPDGSESLTTFPREIVTVG